MPKLLRMPEVAANMAQAMLQEWAVPENAPFTATDAIATVETEKAVVDIEAETDGVILRTLVPGGTQVEVGAPIALLGDPGEKVPDVDAALADLGVVAGSTTREVPDPEGGTANTETTAVQTEAGAANTDGPGVDGADGHRIFASPLARRLARESGLPLETIRGTGPRGRVLRRDVEAATVPPPAAPPAPAQLPTTGSADYTDVPHTRMRRAIADRLSHSKQTIPHFYLRAAVRADALLHLRAELNDGSAPKVSVNDLVVKAVGRAHALVP
ncbi:MAG: E3 binding domain-containing protein, partial [Nocardioidaceae bacterium]